MKNFLFQVLAGILGIYLAAEFLPGVTFIGPRKILLLAGLILGLINSSIKPLLNLLLTPLRLLTFGLIGLVIDIAIVWFVAFVLFADYLKISNIPSLLAATAIIWITSFFFFLLAKPAWRKYRHYDHDHNL